MRLGVEPGILVEDCLLGLRLCRVVSDHVALYQFQIATVKQDGVYSFASLTDCQDLTAISDETALSEYRRALDDCSGLDEFVMSMLHPAYKLIRLATQCGFEFGVRLQMHEMQLPLSQMQFHIKMPFAYDQFNVIVEQVSICSLLPIQLERLLSDYHPNKLISDLADGEKRTLFTTLHTLSKSAELQRKQLFDQLTYQYGIQLFLHHRQDANVPVIRYAPKVNDTYNFDKFPGLVAQRQLDDVKSIKEARVRFAVIALSNPEFLQLSAEPALAHYAQLHQLIDGGWCVDFEATQALFHAAERGKHPEERVKFHVRLPVLIDEKKARDFIVQSRQDVILTMPMLKEMLSTYAQEKDYIYAHCIIKDRPGALIAHAFRSGPHVLGLAVLPQVHEVAADIVEVKSEWQGVPSSFFLQIPYQYCYESETGELQLIAVQNDTENSPRHMYRIHGQGTNIILDMAMARSRCHALLKSGMTALQSLLETSYADVRLALKQAHQLGIYIDKSYVKNQLQQAIDPFLFEIRFQDSLESWVKVSAGEQLKIERRWVTERVDQFKLRCTQETIESVQAKLTHYQNYTCLSDNGFGLFFKGDRYEIQARYGFTENYNGRIRLIYTGDLVKLHRLDSQCHNNARDRFFELANAESLKAFYHDELTHADTVKVVSLVRRLHDMGYRVDVTSVLRQLNDPARTKALSIGVFLLRRELSISQTLLGSLMANALDSFVLRNFSLEQVSRYFETVDGRFFQTLEQMVNDVPMTETADRQQGPSQAYRRAVWELNERMRRERQAHSGLRDGPPMLPFFPLF